MLRGTAAAALAVAILSPVLALPSAAQEARAGDLAVTGAWARAMPPGAGAGAGYMTIANEGGEDDRLATVSSPLARDVQIHEMSMQDGVARMRELADGLPLPAGETVVLKPGGFHLMFMGVETPFAEGDTVPVTLGFEGAGEVSVELPVAPVGAPAHEPTMKMKTE